MPSTDIWADDPWPHHRECLCFRCKSRRRGLEREALIEPRRLVESDDVAEHIAKLLEGGWKRIEIARAAGLSPALVTKASRPGNGLNESTAAKILALGRSSGAGRHALDPSVVPPEGVARVLP